MGRGLHGGIYIKMNLQWGIGGSASSGVYLQGDLPPRVLHPGRSATRGGGGCFGEVCIQVGSAQSDTRGYSQPAGFTYPTGMIFLFG